MTQIKKRMAGHFWKKRLFSKTFFISVSTIVREMPKIKKKIQTRRVN